MIDAMTTTMRAISQATFGGPEVLHEVELVRPIPGPTEVLVRVRAAGVNVADAKHRATGVLLGPPPLILGWDVSGVVEEVGWGSAIHRVGDEVFGMLRYPVAHGAYAEYVVAPSRHFVAKPPELDHVAAAAFPLAALTAWQALTDVAQLREGQRVLIHAAAGGVGHLAVQIAKARDVYVVGTARTEKHSFLRDIGVDELVDYRKTDFAAVVRDMDVVIDTVGGDYGRRSLPTLRHGGVLVSLVLSPSTASGLDPELATLAHREGKQAKAMLVEPDFGALRTIAQWAARGTIRVALDTVFPLSEASKAHELIEKGHTTGKIVLGV
jgi:NADPH:quinone reductase-like Zn-dependent oxidoreductase